MAMQNGLMSGEDKKKLDGYTAVSNESGKFMSASGTWQTPKDDDSWATESLSVETVTGAFNIKKKDGTEAPLLEVLKSCGINAIRLRVWVKPYGGWSGKADVVNVAKKVQAAGMSLMVDFHYSDFFADPSRQTIPEDWKADKDNLDKMCQHVSAHTKEVLQALKDAGVMTAANIGAAASDHTHTNYAAATHTHNYAGSSSAGGSATSAVKLDGFTKATAQTWGNQTGTFVTGMNDDAGGAMGFRKNCPSAGKLSLFVDGLFYQNEGTYPCLDTSSTYTLTETTTGIQVKNSAGTVVCTIPLAGYY